MKRPYKVVYIKNSLNTLQNAVIQLKTIKEFVNKVYDSDSVINPTIDGLITDISSDIDVLKKQLYRLL